MKRNRFNTICSLPKVMRVSDVEIRLHGKFTESLADVSYFVPTSEAVRSLKAGDVNNGINYDFPDGRDTGFKLPKARNRRSDISEISQEVVYKVGAIDEKRRESQKSKKFLEDLKGSSSSKKGSDGSSSTVSSSE